MKYGRCGH
jgi:hypothetical protein